MYGGNRPEAGRAGPWIAAGAVLVIVLLGLRMPGPVMAAANADPVPVATATGSASPAPSDPAGPAPSDPAGPAAADPAAPSDSAGPAPSESAGPSTSAPPAALGQPTPAPPVGVGTTASGAVVDGFVFARIEQSCAAPSYLALDAAPSDVAAFDILRIRFRVDSSGTTETTLAPQLEYRPSGAGSFQAVGTRPMPGQAFALEAECRQVPTAEGRRTETLPSSQGIDPANLRLQTALTGRPVPGEHETGANPAPDLTLPGGAGSEQEFTIRAGIDLAADAGYEFRLTDAGTALPGTTATVRTGPVAASRLSPGQRSGTEVEQAVAGRSPRLRAAAYPLLVRTSALTALARTTGSEAAPPADTLHGPYGMVTDQCSACHRAHTASGPSLLPSAGPTSTLCLTCHNGTGAAELDVAAQYASATSNDPATASYYSHDALAPSTHTFASENEFGDVSNRHSDCVDCHNPHRAGDALATPSPAGWTSSGLLAGDSGVAVTNGAAGTAPTYTFLEGVANPVTLEYQLCFKCHSGFTVLRANDPQHPSWDALDKGIELNPANASFHPIEAQGTNQTAPMAASLAGTSPYKIWDFQTTATIRCANCHANDATPSTPASEVLPNHTSANRGILLRPYRDRELLGATETYAASNFALCYACHAEGPFVDSSSTATRFALHAYHTSDPDLKEWGSGGTDIDTAGGGQSNTVCAECHYRLHSTTFKVGDQDVNGARLVNFAPNVESWTEYDLDGSVRRVTPPTWSQRAEDQGGGGTCTLVCHGKVHDHLGY